jgi:hypothetical protein
VTPVGDKELKELEEHLSVALSSMLVFQPDFMEFNELFSRSD